MTGAGYWLNPTTNNWIRVTRHELAMQDAAAMGDLGVPASIIEAALGLSSYDRGEVDKLRTLGLHARLVRIRDQGLYISVQFDSPADSETDLLRSVSDFFQKIDLWRPYVRVGNLRTNSELTYSWQEFITLTTIPPSRTTVL